MFEDVPRERGLLHGPRLILLVESNSRKEFVSCGGSCALRQFGVPTGVVEPVQLHQDRGCVKKGSRPARLAADHFLKRFQRVLVAAEFREN